MKTFLWAVLGLTLWGNLNLAADPAKQPLRYNRDVRPILSDKCFFCHGPDSKKREADLRFDTREGATANKAIVPQHPELSELLVRVSSDDPDTQMPPPSAKLGKLTPREVDILKRWIAEGAEYEAHWSFIPLRAVDVPASDFESPIDALVAASLKQRGLALQPEASRETLIRRVTFDLTGLPPTPREVAVFAADASPDAYEKLVERLLDSPRFGERMAVDWLDIARYADSYGFQVDRERDVWMWRDWVVKSFNENLPFDQFVTWQLAGDLLPNATDEQILATAFNRLHQQESEGGSVEEEYRVEYVCDRVQTFATAFLGLTFECARCHDHKYDPISQREFYGLFSFFQNIDEAGLYSYFTTSPPTPTLLLADQSSKEKLAKLANKISEVETHADGLRTQQRSAFEAWLKRRPQEIASPGELGRFSFETLDKGNKLANQVNPQQIATLHGENKLVPGRNGNAIEFTGDDPVDLPFGNFQRHEPFSVSLWLKTPDVKDRAVVFHRSQAWTDAASRGYELLIEDGRLKWSLIHFWPGNAISIRAKEPLQLDTWTHVVVTSDGSSRAAGLRMTVNGRRANIEVIKDNLTKNITGGGHDNISLGERFRDRGFKRGTVDEFRVWNRELTELEALAAYDAAAAQAVLHKPETQLTNDEHNLLFNFFLATANEAWSQHLETLKAVRAEQVAFVESLKEIMVMRELPQPKPAYVLFRGEYALRRDQVPPVTPEALGPFPDGAPRNRLGVAQWLTDRKHPLMARVTINRFWQSLFGRGLVKTAEDFGSQGERPLYPEVLDWLSLRFIDSGWNVKALMKAIVLSRTYRQRSIADATVMADDPDNQWLARGPRFRLPAEMIRDNALAASGLLKLQIGGPPVNPYEMTEAFKPTAASAGEGVYRRSLYTNWRRTSPPPALLTFDAPRRAVCTAKRERTDSPLQALILLNGPQYVEAARVLGEKLHKDANGDVAQMIESGFLRCLSRRPDNRESEIVRRLYEEQLAHFRANGNAAHEFLKIGHASRDATVAPAEAAAAAVLAQALLNHDECVVKR